MSRQVREALYGVLDSDVQLTALATGGIHHRIAPDDTEPPYVVFFKMAGNRAYTFEGPPMHGQTWLVKGVGDAESAEDINSRCLTVLSNTALTVDGHLLLLAPMPNVDVDFADDTDGEHAEHVGTQYRIVVEESS